MPQGSGEDFHFPIGRWLLWGLAAIAAVALIVLFFIWFADEEDPSADDGGEAGPQVEWEIVLTDQTGDTVTLKGDEPRGQPTETWRNEIQLIRSPGGTFEWDMEARLPAAVVAIDESEGCDDLNARLGEWVAEIGAATAEPQHWEARAFAQHALDTMRDAACDIDESVLQDVSG